MTQTDILKQVEEIFKQVFENENLIITKSTSPNDIDNWDSLNHAVLINEIEFFYNIKFDFMDMLDFENVGDICQGIKAKIS